MTAVTEMVWVPPDKIPHDQLREMASTTIADAWVDMRQVLGEDLAEMNNMIFACLLTALINTAANMGVEEKQILGEFWGFFPDNIDTGD
jgi:hypothetical protein